MNNLPNQTLGTLSIACIYALRMLGLFMILPVFSVYAQQLPGATPFLIGVALGIYGLTQACLQIPFGSLSDKFGRKKIIFVGLILFAIGSIVAANAHTLTEVIIGRAIQGAGAIGSALTAMVADMTSESNRTKAMATIGMVIALSFMGAMIVGPILNSWIGISGIFWMTAGLALIGVLILIFIVPSTKNTSNQKPLPDTKKAHGRAPLQPYYISIFTLHAILTATFLAIPIALSHIVGMPAAKQWHLYLPVLVLGFIFAVPLIVIAEKKKKTKQIMLIAIFILITTQLLLAKWHQSALFIGLILFFFFTAFIGLEALLPSMVSKLAPPQSKGKAMGIYSTSQFLGIFIGGLLGGIMLHWLGLSGVFLFCACAALAWWIATWKQTTETTRR
jgi:predicted MFS family arabinose efflux permease